MKKQSKYNSTTMTSPLRYPGGKGRAVKHITPIFPDDMTELISPFFGGGSIELALIKQRPNLTVKGNDKFDLLINFWKTVKENQQELTTNLHRSHTQLQNKEKFNHMRKMLRKTLHVDGDDADTPLSDTDKAMYFFAINRSSFSGATFSGGFSQESATNRFTKSSIDRISKLDLSRVTFSSLDAVDFLNGTTFSPTTYIYADPPYMLKNNNLYGMNGDLHDSFDHQAFAEKLKTLDNWVLSYNDTPEVRAMYEGYTIVNKEWKYGMNASKNSSEIVILSPSLSRRAKCV